MRESITALSALKRRIARIGAIPSALGESGIALGHAPMDAALGGGLARGKVHELFALAASDAGSAAGFALMLALKARGGGAVLWLRTEAAERGQGALYAPGLVALGLDPGALVIGVMPDDVALLKAAVDAVRCGDLGAAVIECRGNPRALDLTASRRLAIAAEKSGVTALFLRTEAVPAPSAAETRWAVRPAVSVALEAEAPGQTAIEVELLRRRAGPSGMRWRLEWDRDGQAFREETLSGAVVPVLRDGPAADRGTESLRQTA
ncbi:ImuA family protein [Sphingobium boeckii]|uniref:Protein ImuA n=1 Tax=Sphingobium boeckii TaxID=1082345 RepID=A0A7W9EF01_9SPHN|nr:hypothetical protein [Sphingobium boeckii]MBB5686793.1 protein ImuA [Sphingobium boeckii]